MKLSCNVTRDLLPLYHDGVCSGESGVLVEAHLAECEDCRAILNELRGEIEVPREEPDDLGPLVQIERNVNKGRKRAWIKGIVAALAVVLTVFAGVNLWWFTQVYQFYAQFTEGKPQSMVHEYDPDTGAVIASYPGDPSHYQWHTENSQYFCNVELPDYLQKNGEVALHTMYAWGDNGKKISEVGKTVQARVYIGRDLYTYSVHLTIRERRTVPGSEQLEETWNEKCVMLDADLNQVYLDHWDEGTRARQDELLEKYRVQIIDVVEAAQAQWPFLAE